MENQNQLRYDNRVVLITGAGVGLGKAYAIYFARRGAKVVVNDLGTSHTGTGASGQVADQVVSEIKSFGGVAVADYNSVEFGDKVVKTAIDNFGRIDVVINNAGILRDKAFKNMTQQDWDLILKIHLTAIFSISKAALPYMLQQKYGRIINVSSPSGLYGSFGQVNYSCAKAGIIGFSNALAKEAQKHNILVNVICPIAATRMTETVFSKDILDTLKVDYVVPLVAYLCHESSSETGGVYEVGGRWIAKLRWNRSEGHIFGSQFEVEDVKANFNKIVDFERSVFPEDSMSALQIISTIPERDAKPKL
jgi:NAD(P)-dependent dehydrogenase (short-subunit alcohol dehydrogenase family)